MEKVKEITKGKKLPVIYDAVGKTTWDGSLDCLQPRGLMVSFGNASGPVPPLNLGILASKGSLYVTRPTLATYIAARADLVKRSNDLFNAVKSKKVKIETTARYKLADAAQAHRDLEGKEDDRLGRPDSLDSCRIFFALPRVAIDSECLPSL